MSALFITATGTDAGKTWLVRRLIARCLQQARPVDAIKPVISGFDPDRPHLSDTGQLLDALGQPADKAGLDRVSRWRFRAPLSPDMAAAHERRTVPFDRLVALCHQRAEAAPDLLLIEGIGGAMVPLDDSHTVLDWIEALSLPTIVVAGSYLGTISHSLTTLVALRSRALDVRALVISESEHAPATLEATASTISRFTDIPVLCLPRSAGTKLAGEQLSTIDRILELALR